MSTIACQGAVRAALLSAARSQSAVGEQECHALLELLGTCDAVRHSLRQELARNALTESGFQILAQLIERDAAAPGPAELSATLGLSRRAVAAILTRLELSGLIRRRCPHRLRPAMTLAVTPAGRAAFSSALHHYLETIRSLMSALEPRELANLDQACATLRQISNHATN